MIRSITIHTDRIHLGRQHAVEIRPGVWPSQTTTVLELADLIEQLFTPTQAEIDEVRAHIHDISAEDGCLSGLLVLDAALSAVEVVRQLCTERSRQAQALRLGLVPGTLAHHRRAS